ncbi:unnamed protein product [Closterium sp. NIES-54]
MVADSSDNNPKSNGGAEKKKERTAGQFFHIGEQGGQGDASAKVGAELHPLDYWVLDTGAAWTMTPCKELLDDVRAAPINEVCSASGHALKVAGAGRAAFKGADGKPVVLHDVLLVPDLKANLISLRKLAKVGVSTSTDGARTYKGQLGNWLLWDLHESKDVYRSMWQLLALAWHGGGQVEEGCASQGECNAVGGVGVKVSARSGEMDWATAHRRLGHVAMPLLKQLEKDGVVKEVAWEEAAGGHAEGWDGEKVQEAPAGGGDDVETSGSTKEVAGSEGGEQLGKAKSLVGSLLYAAVHTRPDISFSVGQLARVVQNPLEEQVDAAERVVKYLNSHPSIGVQYSASAQVKQKGVEVLKEKGERLGEGKLFLTCFTDATWASEKDDSSSVGGYICVVGGGPVCWRSKKHTEMALSSVVTEFQDNPASAQHVTAVERTGNETRSTGGQWLTRDAAAHFRQHRTAQALYDAVVARYSSPATAALGRLLLPYLFPDLSAFATVEHLISHLCTSDTRYCAAAPADRCGAARGTPRTTFFEGCSPSPLAPSYASAAAVDVPGAEDIRAASPSARHRNNKGKGGRGGGGGSGGGGGGSSGHGGGSGGGGSSGSGGRSGGFGGVSGGSGGGGGGRAEATQRGGLGGGERQQQQRRSETPSPQQLHEWFSQCGAFGEAAALGASESVLPGTARAEALHTFILDSGASRCFFHDSTTLTPLSAPVPVRLADPSGDTVLTRSSTVLPCPAVAPPCSCRLLSHQTLLSHHCLGHPSLPRLRGMHSCLLVSGLPRSLPPLPPSPAPPCLPCVEGRQHAAPQCSSFPPTSAPLQSLQMDVWGPAHVNGQGHERYFLLVVDDYTQGGEFFSNLLRDFCRGEGILQSFTHLDSPQQNGIAERRIGLVMEVARTSMSHAAAPHFLWPFAVRYAAHQLNLRPRVSLPESSPTLRWTEKVCDAAVFRVRGSQAFVHDTSADKLSARAIPCPEFIRPLHQQPVEVAVGSGAAPSAAFGDDASGGAEPGGAGFEGAGSGGAESEGVESEGAGSGGAEPVGAEPAGLVPGGVEPESVEPGGTASEGGESRGPSALQLPVLLATAHSSVYLSLVLSSTFGRVRRADWSIPRACGLPHHPTPPIALPCPARATPFFFLPAHRPTGHALLCPAHRDALPALRRPASRALPCPARRALPSPARRAALLVPRCPALPSAALLVAASPCPAREPPCWPPHRPALPARRLAGRRTALPCLRAALLSTALPCPARAPP